MLSFLVEDLVRPAGSAQSALNCHALIVAPQDRKHPSKTQTYDDTVLLDELSARGGIIQLQARTYHHVGDWVLSR